MKDYFAAHKAFVCSAGALLVAALGLFLGVALPARSAASAADENADRLQKTVKSSEGLVFSASARKQLEGEVEALRVRVAELEKMAGPPKVDPAADKVVYATRLSALGTRIDKVSSDGLSVEGDLGFPKSPDDDLPVFLAKVEIADKVLTAAIASGVKRIKTIVANRDGDEFFTSEMLDSGGVKRTMVEFELCGSMDVLARLMHALQKKDTYLAVPRAKAWREKPDDPETTLRIAVGGIEVAEAKATEKASDTSGGFNFGR